MGTIIRRSVAPLNCSRTLQAFRGYATVCHTDDNSRRKVRNVGGVIMSVAHPVA
jgi:hypothetical protein